MENTLCRVAIYIRVSTDAQAKKGDSVSEQLETLKSYVDSHDNLILYDTYIDDGVSGQKLNRGDFTRLMNDVRTGSINMIIFTKLDRWFRSLRHYLNTQEILEKYNVSWLAVSQPFYDTTTPQGRAFVAQSMAFAELEAQNTGTRIRDVFNYKYKQGQVLSGKTPMGYSIKDKKLVPNEDSNKILAIFEYYDRVGSLNATILWMEEEYNIIMSKQNLKKSILQNTKYIGSFRDNPNFCQAKVPQKLFERVQHRLNQNIKSSQKHAYIFSGLIVCSCCGYTMYGAMHRTNKCSNGTIYRYPVYRCYGAHSSHHCINRKAVFESTLEKYMLTNIKPLIKKYLGEYNLKSTSAIDIQKKKEGTLKKIDRLKELYINDGITLDEFKTDKAKFLKQIEALPVIESPKKDLSALQKFLEFDLDVIYQKMELDDKRYLWRNIIKEIRIDNQHNIEIIFL